VTGYPIIVADNDFSVQATGDTLNETYTGTNYNPATAPFLGIGSNADQSDTYPSVLKGLIYSSGNLTFTSQAVVTGPLICEGTMTFNGATVRPINFAPYRDADPPPGFGRSKLLLSNGSIQTEASILTTKD
jgi:hypothetical protein